MNIDEHPFLRPARSTKSAAPVLGILDIVVAFLATEIALAFLVVLFLSDVSLSLASTAGVSIILFSQALRSFSPYAVTKFGVGPVKQWHFRFELRDILRGVGFGLLLMLLVASSNFIGLALFDLETDEVSNTAILTEAKESSIFLTLLVLVVVLVGAPVSEELFYRGLVMRVFERIGESASRGTFFSRYGGQITGVFVSALLFGLMHAPTPPAGESVKPEARYVVWFSIFLVGVVLGVIAMKYRRLGPSIIAHASLNSVTTIAVFAQGNM